MSEENPVIQPPKKKAGLIELGIRLGLIAGGAALILSIVNALTAPAREAAALAVTRNAIERVMPPYDTLGDAVYVYVNADGSLSVNPETPPQGTPAAVYYPVFKGKNLLGFAAQSGSVGYGGTLIATVGLDLNGIIGLVEITTQNETPGLGTVETLRTEQKTIFDLFGEKTIRSGLIPNPYLDQFEGKSVRIAAGKPEPWTLRAGKGKVAGNAEPAKTEHTASASQKAAPAGAVVIEYKAGATVTMRAVNQAVYQAAEIYQRALPEITGAALRQQGAQARL